MKIRIEATSNFGIVMVDPVVSIATVQAEVPVLVQSLT